MLNKVILLGRLAQDPVLRFTGTGTPVATFDIAVPVPSKDRNTPPDFFTVVCWRETANFVNNYLSKGRQIVVDGRLSARSYTAQDGTKRKVVEVVANSVYFADSGKAADTQTDAQPAPSLGSMPAQGGGFQEVQDDELPF